MEYGVFSYLGRFPINLMKYEQKYGVAVILKAQKERKKTFSLSELKILIWGGG